MGLGETMYGAGQGATHVVFLTVGTGIGGAVVIDGKLFNGYANRGTELGHVPLIANGEPCACGSVGCLEHYASTSALVRRFSQRIIDAGISYPNEEINGELIVRLYKQGDPIAKYHWKNTVTFGTRNCRLYQYLQSAKDCDWWRALRSRRLLHSESKRKSPQLRHPRLCREYSNHSCRSWKQGRKYWSRFTLFQMKTKINDS